MSRRATSPAIRGASACAALAGLALAGSAAARQSAAQLASPAADQTARAPSAVPTERASLPWVDVGFAALLERAAEEKKPIFVYAWADL
jgi:hypothetical protein